MSNGAVAFVVSGVVSLGSVIASGWFAYLTHKKTIKAQRDLADRESARLLAEQCVTLVQTFRTQASELFKFYAGGWFSRVDSPETVKLSYRLESTEAESGMLSARLGVAFGTTHPVYLSFKQLRKELERAVDVSVGGDSELSFEDDASQDQRKVLCRPFDQEVDRACAACIEELHRSMGMDSTALASHYGQAVDY